MATTKVVILNWNGSEHLRRFLPSVVATTPAGVGVVVADNGSTDDSLSLLERDFPSVEVVRLDKNYGFAGGYNRALRQVDADYFILLNSDVETTPQWCEPLIAAFDADEMLGAVSPKICSWSDRQRFEYAGAAGGFIDALGYPFCRGRIMSAVEQDSGQYDDFRYTFWASGACIACRRELFSDLGGFDDDFFAHMEEIDLCWRAQSAGYKIAVEPQSVVYHLGGGTLPVNSPRKVYLNFRNSLAMLYKNLPKGKLWWVLPARMVLDGLAALVYLLQGKVSFFKSVLKAHIDFYKWVKALRLKRRSIQNNAIQNPQYVYRGSILLRYFLGKKTFGKLL